MPERSIDITIRARDEASAGLASAESGALKFGLRLGGAFAAMRVAIAGVEIARAAVKAWKGDWEGVSDVLAQLPLGMGAFYRAANEAAKEWSGLAEETRKAKEQAEGWLKVAGGIIAASGREAQFKFKTRMLFLPPDEQAIAAINEEAKKATAAARSKAKEEGRGGSLSEKAEVAAIENWRAQAAGEIRRKARDKEIAEVAAGMEARNKLEDADAEEKADQGRKAAEETKKREETTAAQRAEIANRLFDLTHDAREKELHDIDLFYNAAIEKAEGGLSQIAEIQEAWATETAATMNRQREAAEEETGKWMAAGGLPEIEAVAARAHGDWRALESRFLHFLPGSTPAGGPDPAVAQRKEQTALLKQIRDKIAPPLVLQEGAVR